MEGMATALVMIALIGLYAFRQWLRHHQRVMIHRERIAAIERGVELPPLESEVERRTWNVQRMLLLAGLVWISLGIAAYVTLREVVYSMPTEAPRGIQWVGMAGIGIGLSHLIVYFVGKKRERS